MHAIRAGLVVLMAASGAGLDGVGAVAVQNRSVQGTVALGRVREWLSAVNGHQPGQRDAALLTIQKWTDDRLRVLQTDLVSFLLTKSPPLEASFLQFDVAEIRARVIRRGAMLHADAAIMVAPATSTAATSTPRWASGVLIDDGRPGRLTSNSAHWQIGHLLLNALPAASLDPFVDLWYRATTAAILVNADYSTIEAHLARSRGLLPDRAHVWLVSGVVHAYYAAPAVQRATAEITLPHGSVLLVQAERRELDRAEQDFRRALSLDPGNAEARVRLGRVLALKHRLPEALAELRGALGAATDPVDQYFGQLFSGQVEAALGQPDAARASFERAAAIFPGAQTPRLALSELAAKHGDRTAARAALQALAGLTGQPADPWWSYDICYARDWAMHVARLRAWFATEHR